MLVRFDADAAASGSDALIECGKDVAMQIAALNAQYLDKSTVPAEALAKEKEILVAQIQNDPKNANKPEAIIAKMVDGRIGKFYEMCIRDRLRSPDDADHTGLRLLPRRPEFCHGLLPHPAGEYLRPPGF